MAKRRETKRRQVDVVNYIPLMVEYFGAVHAAKLLGFLALWGISGEPKLSDLAYRNVLGLSKSVVYKYFVQLREWAVWLRDEKGVANVADDVDGTLELARRALAEFGASRQVSSVVDKDPPVLLT